MRTSLRRSCDACAKAKHSCDLRTPQCSRCIKRKSKCVYTNQPLGSQDSTSQLSHRTHHTPNGTGLPPCENQLVQQWSNRIVPTQSQISESMGGLLGRISDPATTAFDPFDSYPPTRLPRAQVQNLIHHFLAHISFQYYPLDLEMNSNPFVISWWPQALADAALFHVSLQTASLDVELRAGKGFPMSELLMIDSVALVRRTVENSSSIIPEETMNAVVTLAAIEYGKGNVAVSRMHIQGLKQMIVARGGLHEVKRTSPLTARMVAWVSLIVTGSPQFQTQDDSGGGSGVGPTVQWQSASREARSLSLASDMRDVDPAMSSIFSRLHAIFHAQPPIYLTNTELHDLTCFVMHRLLSLPAFYPARSIQSAISESLRYSLALYMLIIHGATYYSHADLADNMLLRLKGHLEAIACPDNIPGSLRIWMLTVSLVASAGTQYHRWFTAQSCIATEALAVGTWDDVLTRLERILWIRSPQEEIFRQKWQDILSVMAG